MSGNIVRNENSSDLQESIEVLGDALVAYQTSVDHRLNMMEKGVKMENKNMTGYMAMNENNLSARLSEVEKSLRMIDMYNTAPAATVESEFNQEIATYMRNGNLAALEGKSVTYNQADGVQLGANMAQRIFDQICNTHSLLDLIPFIATSARTTCVNISDSDKSSAVWYDPSMDKVDGNDTFAVKMITKQVSLFTCLSVVDIARDLLEDMQGDSLMSWVFNRVSADYATTLNTALLTGDGITAPEGILTALQNERDHVIDMSNPTKTLLGMLGKVDDRYLNNAAWYMSPSFFSSLLESSVGDDGKAVLLKHMQHTSEKGSVYSLFGKPIYIVHAMDKDLATTKCPVILGNLKEGYTLLKHPNVNCRTDMNNVYAGKVRYVFRMRIGGTVTAPRAFVIGRTA